MDWRRVMAYERERLGHPLELSAGWRTCTSRAGGYEPALMVPPEHVRGIDIHTALDAVEMAFRSPQNIAHLQNECDRLGLGRPCANSFYIHMKRALSMGDGVIHREQLPNGDYDTYVRQMVGVLNRRLMDMIVPIMRANKMGFIQHQKDLAFEQVLDRTPDQVRCDRRTTQHPYYNGLN
jgi:hypothetical protein